MAINYTYPLKGSPSTADEFLIIDSTDKSTKKVTASSVLSLTTIPAPTWGTITGTLSTQTDLQSALDLKANLNNTVATITVTSPIVKGADNTNVALSLGTVPTTKGGTGLTTLGTRGQVMSVNSGGTLSFDDSKIIETVRADETIAQGDPLYIVSSVGGVVSVGRAMANNQAKMPSIGVATTSIAINTSGTMHVVGLLPIDNMNTLLPGATANAKVYVGASGGLTLTKPTGTNLIQNVGIVSKPTGAGFIQITAIGRSNDIPNIPSANLWLGNASGVATPRVFSGEVSLSNTGVTAVTGIAGNVSIQGYRPITTVTADSKTLLISDSGKYINFEGSFGGSNSKFLTLPSASSIEEFTVGTEIEVVNNSIPASLGEPQPTLTVRVDLGANPGTINGLSNFVLTNRYSSATLKLISSTNNVAVWHARIVQ